MNEDLLKARDRFIEGIGLLATTVGVSRVIGQLYAILFLSDKPLSLNDMVERLRISKGGTPNCPHLTEFPRRLLKNFMRKLKISNSGRRVSLFLCRFWIKPATHSVKRLPLFV